MIGVFESPDPPPLDVELSLQYIATRQCTLCITIERTIEVKAGQALALNPEAFEESPMLHGAVLALESCGVLRPQTPDPLRVLN